MTTICIEFSSSPAVFSPAENVTGNAILQLDHAVKAKSVRVILEGKASTEWEVTEKSTDSHSRSSLVPYSASLEIIKDELVLWKSDEGRKQLNEGDYKFNFCFALPETCPPSFQGKLGNIRYSITVLIERPWKTNKTFTEYFSVYSPLDLNIVPSATEAQVFSKTKSIGLVFFRYGKVSLQCNLPKTGYVPGENLHVEVDILNESSRQITSLEISLIEIADYVAYRYGAESTRWHGTLDGESSLHDNNRKTEERKILKMDRELHIEPRNNLAIAMDIPLPACVASFDTCPVIHTRHCLEVKITAKGTINTSARCICPIIIGTVPLANCLSGRLAAIALCKEEEAHSELEPSYEPCQYVNGLPDDTFVPLVPFYRHLQLEKETVKIE